MKQTLKIFTLLFASTAFLLTISSCGGDDEPGEPVVYAITLSTDTAKTITLGESVTFHLVDNNNRDLTTDASVSYTANGTIISSNTFTGNTVGTYEINATYNDLTSNTLTVRVLTTAYSQKPLIEDYTGAWCQFCPRVAYAIEATQEETNNVIPIAIHNGDFMEYEFRNTLENTFGVSGYPTAKVNRITDWTYPEIDNIAQITSLANDRSDIGLSISSTRTGNSLSIDVSTKFSLTHTESLKLCVYLLEYGLHGTQVNSTSYYGGASPILNFEYNDVLVKSYTNVLGNAIPSTDTEMNDTYNQHFDVIIPSSSQSATSANLKIVAFIVDGNSRASINAQIAQVGTTQDFD